MNVIDFASEDLVKTTGFAFWDHLEIISKATIPIESPRLLKSLWTTWSLELNLLGNH